MGGGDNKKRAVDRVSAVLPLYRGPRSIPDPRTRGMTSLSASVAGALEQAAAAIAHLDSGLRGHTLLPAWGYRARLEAVARQAAVDGKSIDPWDLAALVEGVRLRLDRAPPGLERGLVLDNARHAFGLYAWFARPSAAQRREIGAAAAHLAAFAAQPSPLLGAAFAVRAWLDREGDRPALRAALARYWYDHGLSPLPCPVLTGAAALGAEILSVPDRWIAAFLDALTDEATYGLVLLRLIERQWSVARRAVAGRRRDSHAAAAIDILAAAPLLSATSLAQVLGVAIKTATQLLDGFVSLDIAIEVTHRAKRRLYGLKHLTPLREAAAPPRQPINGRQPGRPRADSLAGEVRAEVPSAWSPLIRSLPLPSLTPREFDFTDLDRLLVVVDQAIARVDQILENP